MTVGNNDLHENELFNVFTAIKTGIKIQIKPRQMHFYWGMKQKM